MNATTSGPDNVTSSPADYVVHSGSDVRNLMMGLVGFVLNAVAIICLCLSKRIRLTLKVTLISMALNDAAFMLIVVFWGLGFGCWPVLYIVSCSILISYFVTFVLAVYNYVAVFYPLRCKQILSTERSLGAVVSCGLAGYVLGLAFLGVHVPKGTACIVLVVMPRPAIVVYSSLCLLCCCLITVINVRVLGRIRGRYRVGALGVPGGVQEINQPAAITVGDAMPGRDTAKIRRFCTCSGAAISEQRLLPPNQPGQSSSLAFVSPQTLHEQNEKIKLSTLTCAERINRDKFTHSDLKASPFDPHSSSRYRGKTTGIKSIQIKSDSCNQGPFTTAETFIDESLQNRVKSIPHRQATKIAQSKFSLRHNAGMLKKSYLQVPSAHYLWTNRNNVLDRYNNFENQRIYHKTTQQKLNCDLSSTNGCRTGRTNQMIDPDESTATSTTIKSSESSTDSYHDAPCSTYRSKSKLLSRGPEFIQPLLLPSEGDLNKSMNTVMTVPLCVDYCLENQDTNTACKNVNTHRNLTKDQMPLSTFLNRTKLLRGNSILSEEESSGYYTGRASYRPLYHSTNVRSRGNVASRVGDEDIENSILHVKETPEFKTILASHNTSNHETVEEEEHFTLWSRNEYKGSNKYNDSEYEKEILQSAFNTGCLATDRHSSAVETLIPSRTCSALAVTADLEEDGRYSCSPKHLPSWHCGSETLSKYPAKASSNVDPNGKEHEEIIPLTNLTNSSRKRNNNRGESKSGSVENSEISAIGHHTSNVRSISSSIEYNKLPVFEINTYLPSKGRIAVNSAKSDIRGIASSNFDHPAESIASALASSDHISCASTSSDQPLTSSTLGVSRSTPRTSSLIRHQRHHESRVWRYRTQYTLLILCSWCCFLSLPYVVYGTYVALWAEDRHRFYKSWVGMLCSSLVGLNSITNPLLYAWRFVEWRDIWGRIRRTSPHAQLNAMAT